MPRAIFLLPGVGAQGGRVEDLAPAFAPHPAAGLVTASRSIVDAHPERGGDPARAAADAAEELRAAAWAAVTGRAPAAALPMLRSVRLGARCTNPAVVAPLAFSLRSRWWCSRWRWRSSS